MLQGLSIAIFLSRLVHFYQILIIIWCIMSWFPIRSDGIVADIAGALDSLVRPYIDLFRRFIPPFGGLDFSPVLAIVVLSLLQRVIMSILVH